MAKSAAKPLVFPSRPTQEQNSSAPALAPVVDIDVHRIGLNVPVGDPRVIPLRRDLFRRFQATAPAGGGHYNENRRRQRGRRVKRQTGGVFSFGVIRATVDECKKHLS